MHLSTRQTLLSYAAFVVLARVVGAAPYFTVMSESTYPLLDSSLTKRAEPEDPVPRYDLDSSASSLSSSSSPDIFHDDYPSLSSSPAPITSSHSSPDMSTSIPLSTSPEKSKLLLLSDTTAYKLKLSDPESCRKFLEVKKQEVLHYLRITYKEKKILVVKMKPDNILWTPDGESFKLVRGVGFEFKVCPPFLRESKITDTIILAHDRIRRHPGRHSRQSR
jgi:hypothetical protein